LMGPEPTGRWTRKRRVFYVVVVASTATLVTLPIGVLAAALGINPYVTWYLAAGVVFLIVFQRDLKKGRFGGGSDG
jgi:hypothetical protein